MKPFILFALLLINTISFSQNFWNKVEGLYGATSSSVTSDTSDNLYFACSDLFKSTNYGLSWTKINSPSYNSRGIFCNNEVLLSYDSDNLYRSTNYGINWDICLTIEWGGNLSFAFNSQGDEFIANDRGGLYKSTNNGINWINILPRNITSICVDSNDIIYAGEQSEGLYRSTDNGNFWNIIAFQNTTVYSVVINSQNEIFVCAGNTIYKTTNNGTNWILANNGLVNDQNAQLFVKKNDILFVSNRNGVFKSINNGNSWFSTNNELGDQFVYRFMESKNGLIFAGSYGKGLFKTTNEGLNWSISNNGLNCTSIQALFSFGNILLAGMSNSGIYYSSNNGLNWSMTNLNSGGPFSDEIFITKDNFNKFYCNIDSKLYSSIDSGKTWNFISSPGLILNIVFSDNNNMFVGLYGGGLRKSTNGGINWTIISIGHTSILAKNNNGDLYSIYFNTLYRSTNNGESWITMPQLESYNNYSMDFDENNFIYLCNQYGVSVSTNNGLSWITKLSLNYPDKILITQGNIYVLEQWGNTVYYSSNRGLNWNQVNSGIENVHTACIIKNFNGELFCGTYNRGIYKANESIISVNNNSNTILKKFKFYENYPNPFNPYTKFKFDVPIESFVSIKIYDLAGREIMELVNQNYKPGQYEISWDGSDFSSGVYFAIFKSGSFIHSQKTVLLK